MFYGEGIHKISAAKYHANPTEIPALSSSIAKVLLSKSPRHAWTKHPGLNPEPPAKKKDESKFDPGSAAHALVLEGGQGIRVVHHDSWRSGAAKLERENARKLGQVAILEHQHETVEAMAKALEQQLDVFEGRRPFSAGTAEQSLIWEEGGIWFKARPDWLANDYEVIDDYKTTKASAEPGSWIRRQLSPLQFDIQAALYCRGVKHLTGYDPEFRFIVQEDYEPFGVSVIDLSPAAQIISEKYLQLAIDKWAACMNTGVWTFYPPRTCSAEPPSWAEAELLAREDAEESPPQPFDGRAG